jgi:hypothetical protein
VTALAQGLRRLGVAEEHDHGLFGLYGAPKERV